MNNIDKKLALVLVLKARVNDAFDEVIEDIERGEQFEGENNKFIIEIRKLADKGFIDGV